MHRSRLVTLLLLAACGKKIASPAVSTNAPLKQAQLVNGGFESNAVATVPSNWTVATYLNHGVKGSSSAPPASFASLNLGAAGAGKSETFVVGDSTVPPVPLSQVDPDLGPGQSFRYPIYGGRASRVNYLSPTDYGKDQNANSMSQTMTMAATDVDPTDGLMHVRFAVAPVLENPGHGYDQQPYFYVELLNLTQGTTLYTAFNTAGQSGVPWHTTTGVLTHNATQWLDWQLVDIPNTNASLAIGDQVKLTVVGSGCSLGGHFGRIYVDGAGATVPGPYTTASAPASVNSNSTLVYTFHYANGGTTNALGAHVDMTTPSGTTFNASSFVGCTTSAGAALTNGYSGGITCPLSGPLVAGGSGSFTITVNVTATSGTITNGYYSIGAANAPTLLGTPVKTTVNGSGTVTADIAVTKTTTLSSINWGDATHACTAGQQPACTGITPLYTITVTNNSTTKQLDASTSSVPSLTDTMPAGLAPLSGVFWSCVRGNNGSGTHTSGNQTDCSDSGSAKVSLTGSGNISLKPRLGYNKSPCAGTSCTTGAGSITISVWGTVKAGSGIGSLVNTAASSAGSGIVDPDTSNNSAIATIPIGTPVTLTVTKTGSGTVTSSTQPGINCGATCSATVIDTSQIVLNASAAALSQFTGWTGCTPNPSLATQCTVTMAGAKTVTATFAAETIGAAAAVYIYTGNNQKALAPSAFALPIKALVTDASQNAVSGQTVTFLAPATGASVTFTGGSACATPQTYCRTAVTDANGIASVSVTASSTVGAPYSVTATDAALAPATFTLTNYGPPAVLSYLEGGNTSDPGVATENTQFATPLGAMVTDSAGNPIPGVTVNFAVPGSVESATLSAASAVTDSNGQALVTATANGGGFALSSTSCDATHTCASGTTCISGYCGDPTQNYNVTASSGALSPFNFVLRNVPAGATNLFVASGSPQTTPVSSPFSQALVAAVSDSLGNPVPGVMVTFSAPTTGASVTLAGGTACSPAHSYCQTDVTDANGLVSVTATANATGGPVSVSVAAGALTPVTFSLSNDGGDAIAAFAGSNQTAPFNTQFTTTLQAIVQDSNGDFPVVTVTFNAPTSGPSVVLTGGTACSVGTANTCRTQATSGTTGLAAVTATSNALAGTYTVLATTPLAPGSASFTLTNTCTASSQCSGTTPVCDTTTTHACIACSSDTDCSGSTPHCDTTPGTGGACFACTADTQCSGTSPICDTITTHACVACSADAQCYNKNTGLPFCDGTGACFTCTTSSQCTGNTGCDTSTHTCMALACAPALVSPTNGTVSATTGVTGDTPTYACNAGYTLSGASSTTCLVNQTWSNPAPTCVANACAPALSAPTNGSVSATTGVTGSTSTYTCNAGYTITGSSSTTCTTAGTWSNAAPTCTANACAPVLVAPTNGTVSSTTGHTGDTETYACNAGYTRSGNASTTCTTGGTWSNSAPTCTANACAPALSAPTNGTVSSTSGTTGQSSTYTCNAGYTISGSATTTCQTSGAWSPTTAPTCVAQACAPALAAPTNGTVSATSGTTGQSSTYACNAGYTLSGSATTTCQTNNTWSPATAPTCTANACAPALVAPTHGTVSATTGTTGNTSTFTCNAGYTLTGSASTTCQTSGAWSNATPTCAANPCAPALTAPSHGTVTSTTGVTGDTSTYACDSGFTLTGTATTTCQTSGAWSPTTAPTCACQNDVACGAGNWCSTGACTPLLANGAIIPTDPTHSPALTGACDAGGLAVCASGACDSDGLCGIHNGDGTCAPSATSAVCRSGVCDPDGRCGYANGDGTCTSGDAPMICRSGVCDAGNCGYANGDGPCVAGDTAATVCQSNTCSAHVPVCVPALDGCAEDDDCGSAQWCNPDTYLCVAKLANKTAIPTTTNAHSPLLGGTCTTASGVGSVGAAVCVSGVCDTSNDACGYVDGASCADGSVCQNGACTAGGQCASLGGCFADSDCTAPHTWCDIAGGGVIAPNTCVPATLNANPMPSDSGHTSPTIDGVCRADLAAALVCASGVCDTADSQCGFADGDGSCDSTSAGTVCRSSTCSPHAHVCIPSSNGCAVDRDCQSTEWCDPDHLTCTAKLANLAHIPTTTKAHAPALTGVCTDSTVGAAVCATGACDASDDRCGYLNGDGPCTAGAECRSGSCSVGGTCKDAGACAVDGDCDTSTQFCDTPAHACTAKIANGGPLPMVAAHAPVLDGVCSTSEAAAVCVSGVCDADNKCGHADGGACSAATVCRSSECGSAGLCVECVSDAQCSGAQAACDTARGVCVQCSATHAAACTGATPVCTSGGSCGACTGSACGGSSGGTPSGCTQDSDCPRGDFCAANACVAQFADGVAAASADQCTSGVLTRGLCGPPKLPTSVRIGGNGLGGCSASPASSALVWLLSLVFVMRRRRSC